MRYLGVDYGSKKVGLALSDEAGDFALPLDVWPTDNDLVNKIVNLCHNQKITTVIIGESLNYDGTLNPVGAEAKKLGDNLTQAGLLVEWLPEWYSSKAAEREIGRDGLYDARAAAIILQTYLDKLRYARLA